MRKNNKTIAVSALLVSGIVFADYGLAGDWPPQQQVVGLTVAYFIIAGVNDIGGSSVASMFALLLLVAILLERGPDLLTKLNNKTNPPKGKA